MPAARFDRVAMALHWAIAAGVLGQIALGVWMIRLPDSGGIQAPWFNLHKSIGLTLALLVLVRLGWRALHPAPPLPAALAAWQRRAAHFCHAGLYACLLVLPLTGYLGSSLTKYPVRYFGYALPRWGAEWPAAKELLSTVHLGLTWVLGALVLVHIGAALAHLASRDGLFYRMWPRAKSL
jgi:cytochrome b561